MGLVCSLCQVWKLVQETQSYRLCEKSWLQLMCCAVCLLQGHNFRRKNGVQEGEF